VLTLATVLAALAVTFPAEARRHHTHRQAAEDRYEPPYASIIVDANAGVVMQASNADSPRHPASLTKLMTLYLLFEQLEAGKLKMTTELPVSEHAAAMAPSKLGLKPGESIDVASAIRAIVTKSANDVAVVVAEAIGGGEAEFARMMTAKARALGMMHTTYHNASGLPDERQITTARDQSIIARALHDRFPQFFHFFSLRHFVWRGKTIRNHNHLLGRVPGVDGMKTGYIRESGFNIVVSVHRDGRWLVAVIFGGRSAGGRDARAVSLINNNINVAAAKRTAPLVVEGGERRPAPPAAAAKEQKPAGKEQKAAALPLPAAAAARIDAPAPPAPGSTEPIRPVPVRTVTVQPGATASLSPPPPESRTLSPAPPAEQTPVVTTVATTASAPPAPPAQLAAAGAAVPLPAAREPTAKPRGGWMIQVGALESESEARRRLSAARKIASEQLDEAAPFTEPVAKGDRTLYRARFAGLEKRQAEAACKHLKHGEIPCILIKN
jgi:D-alanyl-D-alanine carboxypeptidase